MNILIYIKHNINVYTPQKILANITSEFGIQFHTGRFTVESIMNL